MNKNNLIKTLIILCIVLVTIFILKEFAFIFKKILLLFLPLIFGFVITFLLHPIVKRFNKVMNKKLSVIITFILFLVVVSIFTIFITPKLYYQLLDFIKNTPRILDNIINKLSVYTKIDLIKYIDIDTFIKEKTIYLENLGINLISKIFSIISCFIISLIISIYLLFDYDELITFIKKFIEQKKWYKIRKLLLRMKEVMYGYFNGLLIVSIFLFLISTIIFYFLDYKYPIVIGLLISLTNLIPYFGPYVGAIFSLICGLVKSFKVGIIGFIIVLLLQMIESNYVTPKIQGKIIKTKPIFVLLMVLIMGNIFGIIGMILAVPFLTLIQNIISIFILNND